MTYLNLIFSKYKSIITYLFCSVLSTVVDVCAVYLLFEILKFDIVTANSCGVVLGFVVSFVLSSKYVFDSRRDLYSFVIYFSTFILGLIVADFLILFSYEIAFEPFSQMYAFVISKCISIVVPFFIMYFIRKNLYKRRNSNV